MLPQSLSLCLFLSLIGLSRSADTIQVISGVFMLSDVIVDYDGAKMACASRYSSLATLEQITNAFKHGYEFCKWGWVEEHKIVMLRLTPFLPCSNYNVGILIRDCPNTNVTFCVNKTGVVYELPILSQYAPFYENASKTCLNDGSMLATKNQIHNANKTNLTSNRFTWYDFGVGQIINGNFEPNSCDDIRSHAFAFCYNPTLSDVLIINDNRTWKKIAIGCIIALIFVMLLIAAIFMKGNQFICCMKNRDTKSPAEPHAAVPTWNTTSVYKRISHINMDPIYDNTISIKKHRPAIRPEMSHYNTHYSNMAYETTGEE